MSLDERLAYAGSKIVKLALRDLRRAKEVRTLIKEVLALGDEEKKLHLIGILARERPEVVPPLVDSKILQ
jgi:hypothetical protein